MLKRKLQIQELGYIYQTDMQPATHSNPSLSPGPNMKLQFFPNVFRSAHTRVTGNLLDTSVASSLTQQAAQFA